MENNMSTKLDTIKADIDAITGTAITSVQQDALADTLAKLLNPLLMDPNGFITGAYSVERAAQAITAGKPVAALGSGTPAGPTALDPTQALMEAMVNFARAGKMNETLLGTLLGLLNKNPDKLKATIVAAEGNSVDKSELEAAEAESQRLVERLKDIEVYLGIPKGQLTGAGWMGAIDIVRSKPAATTTAAPPTPATGKVDPKMVQHTDWVLQAVKAAKPGGTLKGGKRSVDVSEATIDAALAEIATITS